MSPTNKFDDAEIGLNVRRDSRLRVAVRRSVLTARPQAIALAVRLAQFALCCRSYFRCERYRGAVVALLFALMIFCNARLSGLASAVYAAHSPAGSGKLRGFSEFNTDIANILTLMAAFLVLYPRQLDRPMLEPLIASLMVLLAFIRMFCKSVTFNAAQLLDPTVGFETFLCAIHSYHSVMVS